VSKKLPKKNAKKEYLELNSSAVSLISPLRFFNMEVMNKVR
jgi:hypothetical protein